MRDSLETTRDLLAFIDASPTPFHAVRSAIERLERAGFSPLRESEPWALSPGDRRYVVRNHSSLAALIVGSAPASESGFAMVGAHTDSPNLRLKPIADVERCGYAQASIEVYGGVLLNSWLDRDLGLAGRIVVHSARGSETRLYRSARPLARIPQLAIHLDREVNERGLILNKEMHLSPVLSLAVPPTGAAIAGEACPPGGAPGGATGTAPVAASPLLTFVANELGVRPDEIAAHELMFFDLAPSTLSGLNDEFIHAPRLDNLASCHAALGALLRSADTPLAATRAIVLYDNEEIGSATLQGASGPFLEELITRLVPATSAAENRGDGRTGESIARARARSFFISADMAHAIHPNYADRHEPRHAPRINAGPVIKVNANARYATDAETSAHFQLICRAAEVPVQRFAMRADIPCGSTIGPLVSTRLGIKTVDVGNPMLSMHSIREMAGSLDPEYMTRALTAFFEGKGGGWE